MRVQIQISPEEIKALRLRMQMGQESFAHLVGVSYATIRRWESGKTSPRPVYIKILKQISLNNI